uniref:Uncharacterized protein n=1 Tax=Chromera velia CCMP2878 TaxID=1169474 RepID=A0A0G4FBQ3_9ALVE|eukprot:Cvel_16206.t1-p1 / transcript=Cvel_16206.t1 / gene=Cvel_16206 / organism=Chromera_velia_CCMP2878 / gene_product=hypothetical protein / transcript_product=hypothetical protein / location=Cvel_scaffold1238:10079-12005(-) / protein_length=495 / sequence_SO=supercontig / SO=protein_coding / is_pseudo=false
MPSPPLTKMDNEKVKGAGAAAPHGSTEDKEAAKKANAAFLASVKEISIKGVTDMVKGHPLWAVVTILTFVSMGITSFYLLWDLPSYTILFFKTVLSPRTYVSIFFSLWFVLRHFVFPLVVILGNIWLFRQSLLRVVSAFLKDKKGVLMKEPQLKASWDCSAKTCQLDANGLKLCEGLNEADEIVRADAIIVGLAKAQTETTGALAVDINVVLDGVEVTFVAYDPKFKDTNINRLIAKIAPPKESEKLPEEPEKEEEDEEKKKEKEKVKKESRVRVIALIRSATIHVKVGGPLGVRQAVPPIKLVNEQIDPQILSHKLRLVAWLNGLILRTIANSGFDAVASAFSGAGHVVEGASDFMLSGIDKVAGFVPGGQVLTGATGGVRDVVGGTMGGVGKVADGLAGGGKALVEGFTSGSVSGVGKGLVGAGKSVGEGMVGGVTSTVGGVGKGVTSLGKGFFGAGKSLFGRGKDKNGSGSNVAMDEAASKGEEEPETTEKN